MAISTSPTKDVSEDLVNALEYDEARLKAIYEGILLKYHLVATDWDELSESGRLFWWNVICTIKLS